MVLTLHGDDTVDVCFMTGPFYLPHDFRWREEERMRMVKEQKKKRSKHLTEKFGKGADFFTSPSSRDWTGRDCSQTAWSDFSTRTTPQPRGCFQADFTSFLSDFLLYYN